MTIEWMMARLGITEEEKKALMARNEEKSLPGHYGLEAYLIVQMIERQNRMWVGILNELLDVQRSATTLRETEELYAKLSAFIRTL